MVQTSRRGLVVALGGALTLGLAAAAVDSQQPAFDLVITNARLIDGTGAPARRADIGINDGKIVRIGTLGEAQSRAKLDAGGLVVSPGFIDVHTHADNLASSPLAANFVRMGVTTIVAGNCGSSALAVGEALEKIARATPALNFATLIGHNTVRNAVMGSAERDPTADELDRMKALVRTAMSEGAVGFSTGLQYVPGTYSKSAEIIELARVAAGAGGLYATHMRNEGTALEAAVRESIDVARANGMRLQISHLKVDSPSRWGASTAALTLIDAARAEGVDVRADQYAYTAGSSSLSIRVPSWALEGGSDRIRERLNDPATWARIKKEMIALYEERGFSDLSWAAVASYRPDPSLNGLSMKDVAHKLSGSTSADAQLESARTLMLGGGASMVYHFMSEDDIERIMKHAQVAVASDSDVLEPGAGVPHPRGNGNTARVLAEYVRERKVISLEEAVRKMTSLPAGHFGFRDRGVVREGAAADLVVFDPARVRDRATYAAPHAAPDGIVHVLVNGVPVVRDGEPTGARPGVVLRHQR
ncbi:MAG TPA: D-aminoacylase [Vicinamibacterales bacterium]|nr:D-aminoacylase [Vicinamibacterales bacterium]